MILDRLEGRVRGPSRVESRDLLGRVSGNIDAPGGTFRTTTLPAPMRAKSPT